MYTIPLQKLKSAYISQNKYNIYKLKFKIYAFKEENVKSKTLKTGADNLSQHFINNP